MALLVLLVFGLPQQHMHFDPAAQLDTTRVNFHPPGAPAYLGAVRGVTDGKV